LVFSLFLTAGSAMTNETLFAILVFIDLALFTLVLNIMAKTPKEIVGAFLILAAASSFYGAAGILINTMSGRTVVPPGKALWQPTGAAHR
jgi:succinate-acetate transporter protein